MFVFLGLLFFTVALFFYISSLHGPFILDDQPNFYGLKFVDDFSSAIAYAINGPAGIRPLSYLSFTLPFEINSWNEGDAFYFKLINLIIHTINSVFVFYTLKALTGLSPQLSTLKNKTFIAFICSVIWFIHPIHVNTVLYSVQRMTLLSCSMVLTGLLYHLAFIKTYKTCSFIDWLRYSFILGSITLTGILFKESAVLLPLLITTLFTLSHRPFSKIQTFITFYLPYIVLLILLIFMNRLDYGYRDFTLTERLLNEVIILWSYIEKLLWPNANAFSLYYDDYIVVKSVFDAAFIQAALCLLSFIGLSIYINRFIPGVLFGVLFFFVGHSLESSFIPLELYFDHRNYLPSIGLIFSSILIFQYAFYANNKKLLQSLILILAMALSLQLLFLLKTETKAWSNDATLSESLIIKHPNSMRANQYYIETLANQGQYGKAAAIINLLFEKFGINISNALFQVGFACINNPNATINHQALISDIAQLPYDTSVSDAMDFLLMLTKNKQCISLNWDMYDQYTEALLHNPQLAGHFHNLVFLHISSFMQRADFKKALEISYELQPGYYTPQFLFLQMHLALSTNNITAAKKIYTYIQAFDKTKKILYKSDIQKIQTALQDITRERSH